jgi:hypothetical protein
VLLAAANLLRDGNDVCIIVGISYPTRRVKRIVILHLGNYLLIPDSGVARKTFALADSMRSMGLEVHCVAFPFLYSGNYTPNPSVEVVFEKESVVYEAITHFFRTKIQRGDIVLFRYPFATSALVNLVREFGHQIIFEHNTIESVEVLMLQRSHLSRLPFSWRPSYLRYAFQTRILQQTDETRLGPLVLNHSQGGICVSHEIAKYEVDRCGSYSTAVVANGSGVPAASNLQVIPFQNNLRVCMIIGSPAIWHGYDRMFEGLKHLSDENCTIWIDIIGMDKPKDQQESEYGGHRVQWLGVMNQEEIARHLQQCHMAIGTLALFRKKMKEASPLKVRECLMQGMPMILGYYDTDVSADERFSPYIFQVSNSNEPINWSKVVSFYKGLSQNRNHKLEIAQLAGEVLSMQKKAEAYVAFMRTRFEAARLK